MYICVYAYIHMYNVKSQTPTCSQGVFLQTFSSSWNICVLSVKAKGFPCIHLQLMPISVPCSHLSGPKRGFSHCRLCEEKGCALR